MDQSEKKWMSRKSTIAGIEVSNGGWMIALWALSWVVGLLAVSSLGVIQDSFLFFIFIVGVPGSLMSLWIAFRAFLPNVKTLVAVTLGVAAAAFAIESLVLENCFFANFSSLTKIFLWLTFGTLPFIFFKEYLPKWVCVVLMPLFVFGSLLSIPFAIKLSIIMTLSWLAIPFAGIGLLTYAPIFAIFCFLQSWLEVSRRLASFPGARKTGFWASALTVFIFISFTGHVRYLLNEIEGEKQSLIAASESQYNLDKDLPRWFKVGQIVNSEPLARFFLGSYDNKFQVGRSGQEFDPFLYIAGLGFDQWSSYERSWFDLARSGVFNEKYETLFFTGSSEWIDSVNSHVQIFPKQGISYTETQLVLNSKRGWDVEVDMTIHIPSASVASQLSLWIDGVEQPARFATKSDAKHAYEEIVSKRRDPAILEWIDDSKLRLRVFPVSSRLPRKVKFGVISSLSIGESEKIRIDGFDIYGIDRSKAAHHLVVDVFDSNGDVQNVIFDSSLQTFEKIPVFESQALHWVAQDVFKNEWFVDINNLDLSATRVPKFTPKSLEQYSTYCFLINQSRTPEKWASLIKGIVGSRFKKDIRLLIVGEHVREVESLDDLADSLEKLSMPKSNVFPFYTSVNGGEKDTLFFAPDDWAPSLFSFGGSDFYRKTADIIVSLEKPFTIVALDDSLSNYYESLAAIGAADIVKFKDGRFFQRGLSLGMAFGNIGSDEATGDDLTYPHRLISYRQALLSFGKSGLDPNDPTLGTQLAVEQAHIVTPFSTLLVLESEKDYVAYGIDNVSSELNNTQPTDPSLVSKLGVVPEPHEYLLLILCLGIFAYFYRDRWLTGVA